MRPAVGARIPRSAATAPQTAGEAKSAALVIGPDGAALRRQVGPMAWCVLEALAASPLPGDGNSVVLASVRSIAHQLGVSRNTVHRALVKLTAAGLVEARQRRADSGRFDAGFCRLCLPETVLALVEDDRLAETARSDDCAASSSTVRLEERAASAAAPAGRGGRSRSRRSAAVVGQLSLPGV